MIFSNLLPISFAFSLDIFLPAVFFVSQSKVIKPFGSCILLRPGAIVI
jgi:hypothetical protein